VHDVVLALALDEVDPGDVGGLREGVDLADEPVADRGQRRGRGDRQAEVLLDVADHPTDVLQSASVHTGLDQALNGTVFAAACTARSRDLSHAVLTARETAARLVHEAARGPVALVFGPEKYGLTVEEVNRCSVIAMVPANPHYSSLNLAAAVQIFAYEVHLAAQAIDTYPQEVFEPAPYQDLERLFEHLEQTLYDIEFLDPKNPKRLMRRLRRLFQRARLEREEVNILRGILAAAQKRQR